MYDFGKALREKEDKEKCNIKQLKQYYCSRCGRPLVAYKNYAGYDVEKGVKSYQYGLKCRKAWSYPFTLHDNYLPVYDKEELIENYNV